MTGRYVFTPAVVGKIGRRVTLADRFRAWKIHREERRNRPDIFTVTGYR